jgi:hypothetical protein
VSRPIPEPCANGKSLLERLDSFAIELGHDPGSPLSPEQVEAIPVEIRAKIIETSKVWMVHGRSCVQCFGVHLRMMLQASLGQTIRWREDA